MVAPNFSYSVLSTADILIVYYTTLDFSLNALRSILSNKVLLYLTQHLG